MLPVPLLRDTIHYSLGLQLPQEILTSSMTPISEEYTVVVVVVVTVSLLSRGVFFSTFTSKIGYILTTQPPNHPLTYSHLPKLCCFLIVIGIDSISLYTPHFSRSRGHDFLFPADWVTPPSVTERPNDHYCPLVLIIFLEFYRPSATLPTNLPPSLPTSHAQASKCVRSLNDST